MKPNKNLAKTISSKIKQSRQGLGWSQANLADRAGITRAALSMIEKGGRIPTLPVALLLSKALGLSVEGLVGEEYKAQDSKCGQELFMTKTGKLIAVDTCTSFEIAYLWQWGVQTLGVCCGHSEIQGTVVVEKSSESIMELLDYESYTNRHDVLVFYLKGLKPPRQKVCWTGALTGKAT